MSDVYDKKEFFEQKKFVNDIHQRNIDFLMFYEEICDFMREKEHEWFPNECTKSNWNERTTKDIFEGSIEDLRDFMELTIHHFCIPLNRESITFEEWDNMPTLAHGLTKCYKKAFEKKK